MEQMGSHPLAYNMLTGKKLPVKKDNRFPVNRSGAVNKACFTTVRGVLRFRLLLQVITGT